MGNAYNWPIKWSKWRAQKPPKQHHISSYNHYMYVVCLQKTNQVQPTEWEIRAQPNRPKTAPMLTLMRTLWTSCQTTLWTGCLTNARIAHGWLQQWRKRALGLCCFPTCILFAFQRKAELIQPKHPRPNSSICWQSPTKTSRVI